MATFDGDPPHFITEPLRSFTPQNLDNGDIRMAIAKEGQKAYSFWGDEATLTKDFLSKDFATWDEGLVSINHENNNEWVKATLYDPEYDSKTGLVICSFAGLPDWVKSLINSEDYRGLSQECIPVKFAKNSMDVIRGFGTGVTIVTAPYEPAANQEMGVGIRPELKAILASKYPISNSNSTPVFQKNTQIDSTEDNMADKQGGGTPAISLEAYESTVSRNVQLESRVSALESENKQLKESNVTWESKYNEQVNGEAKRIEIAISDNRKLWETELKEKTELESAISELKTVMSEDSVTNYLATNPTLEQIKSITGIMKINASKNIGSSQDFGSQEQGKSYEELDSIWNARLGRS